VREIVVENPGAARVFERLGIDYCCGGGQSLEEACAAGGQGGIDPGEVLAEIESWRSRPEEDPGKDWRAESLASLIDHITATHHAYVRNEIPRIKALLDKVCGVHGENHPELFQVRDVFAGLAEELGPHLRKEEQILFPYIVALEAAQGGTAPQSCFGSVGNPIRVMMSEHDRAGAALRELRRLAIGYTAPPDACISFRTLYSALDAFEADLHRHIHLENNILFPRALALAS
jgi:regulator of cell morphogenesis and NO signaling